MKYIHWTFLKLREKIVSKAFITFICFPFIMFANEQQINKALLAVVGRYWKKSEKATERATNWTSIETDCNWVHWWLVISHVMNKLILYHFPVRCLSTGKWIKHKKWTKEKRKERKKRTRKTVLDMRMTNQCHIHWVQTWPSEEVVK